MDGKGESTHRRLSVNVAVVLDRSGSMAMEGKIVNAKAALREIVGQLRSTDLFALVVYDDVVDVLRPSSPVGRREDLCRIVDEIEPRGWTNLGGGMMEGFRQARRNAREGYINRVILLSDGLANRGLTDARELQRVAGRERSAGTSLSAVGVGVEYNENLLLGLAECGGGNYYFIDDARTLASALRKEFDRALDVVAQNTELELTVGRGVRIADVIGAPCQTEGNRCVVNVGDLAAGEQRTCTVVLDVPPGEGELAVASGVLRYDPAGGRDRRTLTAFHSSVRYTERLALIDEKRDQEVQARGDIAMSTRTVEEAMKAFDDGRRNEAEAMLHSAQSSLAASPALQAGGATAEVLQGQEKKLRGYTDALKDSSRTAGRAKKEIQFDNYRTQTGR
jgi:Ca-activated chloride channel family protein